MFTGIVEDTGRVEAVEERGGGEGSRLLTIQARLLDEEMPRGASLAVDGVCLTIVAWRPGRATATAAPETLARTTLGRRRPGDRVNLERALRLGDRLGGHWVMGHVDGVGRIARRAQRGAAIDVTVAAAPDVLRYVVEKGSIAVDGVSLTINAVDGEGFQISLIPHTQGATTLAERPVGGEVNLEVDVLGKYVEKLLGRPAGGREGKQAGLTLEKLKEYGFGD